MSAWKAGIHADIGYAMSSPMNGNMQYKGSLMYGGMPSDGGGMLSNGGPMHVAMPFNGGGTPNKGVTVWGEAFGVEEEIQEILEENAGRTEEETEGVEPSECLRRRISLQNASATVGGEGFGEPGPRMLAPGQFPMQVLRCICFTYRKRGTGTEVCLVVVCERGWDNKRASVCLSVCGRERSGVDGGSWRECNKLVCISPSIMAAEAASTQRQTHLVTICRSTPTMRHRSLSCFRLR
jgi:hypothetical protein